MRVRARWAAALIAGIALPALPGLGSSAPSQTPTATVTTPNVPVAVGPVPVAPAALLPGRVHVGMADQKPDMFSDDRFVSLGITNARLAIGWDAMGSSWQVQQLDEWLAGARALNVRPLISFGHSRTQRRTVPTPDRMASEFRKLRRRYPWVKTFAVWNEANHCGEPVCHKPQRVASYYRVMRAECPSCTILGPEILDMPNAIAYVRAFRSTSASRRRSGACTTTSRPTASR